jgi:hypothetical protein
MGLLLMDYNGLNDSDIKEISEFDPVVWAMYHRLKNEKGEILNFKEHPYQVDILEDVHPDIVIIKGSQVGMTTMQVVKLLFMMDNNRLTVIYTFPTQDQVNKFAGARFGPMINRTKYLKERIGGLNNNSVKNIGDSYVYFSGTFTESQAISVPADIVIHDELDFSKPDIREVYSSRLSHSKWKYTWLFSTPTVPDYGIDAAYKKSDQRRWLIKCEHCGKWQECTFFKNIVTIKRETGLKHRFWGCYKCKKPLNRANGKWVQKLQKKSAHGYFIPPSICPWITPKDLIKLKRNGTNNISVFYQFHLGQAYAGGDNVLNRAILLNAMSKSPFPDVGENYFMGVDQGNTLHYEISRHTEDNKREVVFYGTTTDFKYLDFLMEKWNVRACVIDALPNTHDAKEFRDRFPGRVWTAHYQNIVLKEKIEYKDAEEPYTLTLSRSETLDNAASQWITGQAIVIPADGETIPIKMWDNPDRNDGWLQQMTNMKREVTNNQAGEPKVVWTDIGADHFRHADNYNYIAHKMFKQVDPGRVYVGGASIYSISSTPGVILDTSAAVNGIFIPEEDDDVLVAAGHPFEEFYGGYTW